VILFVQQASRYADIFFNINIPRGLIWELTFALIPNVIAFTCPMAILIGVIIGLSKMLGDSELVAIRASGVGSFQIALPIALLGILLSGFAFFINLKGVPFASRVVRQVALQTALYKLESPIEPGIFNAEINGYTVFVKNGDIAHGNWENLFIFNEDKKNNIVRLITAEKGRIDSTINPEGESAELVLNGAKLTTAPLDFATISEQKIQREDFGEIRLAIKTSRDNIVKKITQAQETPEELGLEELARLTQTGVGKERVDAQILWQRRIILSVTPFIFSLLGIALVLRFNRGGRGFGIVLAFISLVTYYFVTLFGEQLTRAGKINIFFAGFLPIILSLITIGWLFLSARFLRRSLLEQVMSYFEYKFSGKSNKISSRNFYLDLTTGIRDFDIIINVLKYLILTIAFLTAVFLIFTTFELWKFIGETTNGISSLFQYLFYLLPFIYMQIVPSALMIAILATYIIKSRQNELVTWTAAGQSLYRLLLPCFYLMIFIGAFNWAVQEYIAPKTNQMQDSFRSQIRSKGILAKKDSKYWVANGNKFYSFESVEKVSGTTKTANNVTVYEFADKTKALIGIYTTPKASWQNNQIFLGETFKVTFENEIAQTQKVSKFEIIETENPFKYLNQKPSHLTSAETRIQMQESESETEKRILEVALIKKQTTPFLPILILLITAPFALSINQKGKVVTVGYAVAVWLVFMGVSSTFEQSGLTGNLPPLVAVWTPLLIFSIIGVFLVTRVKT
jgi:LPS export ABC transporter permease LptG